MDLMALVAFLHVSFLWYVSDRFLLACVAVVSVSFSQAGQAFFAPFCPMPSRQSRVFRACPAWLKETETTATQARFLSKFMAPRSQTLSVSSMTVFSKESFSMLGVLVNRDVNNITSVFSALFLSHGNVVDIIQIQYSIRPYSMRQKLYFC